MLRFLRSLFAWNVSHRVGLWEYSVNSVTGQRSANYLGSGYQPVDWDWLMAGDKLPIVNGDVFTGRYRG